MLGIEKKGLEAERKPIQERRLRTIRQADKDKALAVEQAEKKCADELKRLDTKLANMYKQVQLKLISDSANPFEIVEGGNWAAHIENRVIHIIQERLLAMQTLN